MRNVRIHSSQNDAVENFQALAGAEFDNAIGYLSRWSFSRFPRVDISINWERAEIGAAYLSEDGKLGYFIAGIFDEKSKTFSFHS